MLQDGNVVEEIHSSFEDLSVTREESKIKEHLQTNPTIHFDHGHVNIATEWVVQWHLFKLGGRYPALGDTAGAR